MKARSQGAGWVFELLQNLLDDLIIQAGPQALSG